MSTPAIHSNERETQEKVDRIIEQRRQFGEWWSQHEDRIARLIHTRPYEATTIAREACWLAFEKGAKGR
jgi:hypothetical protein